MVRLAAFSVALLITLTGIWLSFAGVEYFMTLLPHLRSGHRYIRWAPLIGSFLPWIAIFLAFRRPKTAPETEGRLTPLPPRSRRPL